MDKIKMLLIPVLALASATTPIKADNSYKNFEYSFEPGRSRIVLNRDFDTEYTSTSAQMHNMVDYGDGVNTIFYEPAVVTIDKLDGTHDVYYVPVDETPSGEVLQVTDEISVYVYETGLMLFNVKENSGERITLDFTYYVDTSMCGTYYVQFSGEHVYDNLPNGEKNERFEEVVEGGEACAPNPDAVAPEDWDVEGGYGEDPSWDDKWEDAAANNKPAEPDEVIVPTPIEPSEPVTPTIPKETLPMIPLEPAKPIINQPSIKDEGEIDNAIVTNNSNANSTTNRNEELKEDDVLPQTGVATNTLMAIAVILIVVGVILKSEKE